MRIVCFVLLFLSILVSTAYAGQDEHRHQKINTVDGCYLICNVSDYAYDCGLNTSDHSMLDAQFTIGNTLVFITDVLMWGMVALVGFVLVYGLCCFVHSLGNSNVWN